MNPTFFRASPFFHEERDRPFCLNLRLPYPDSVNSANKSRSDQSIRYLFGELNLNKKFYQLSFGQKKKLQLLLLMLVNKPIWILDDPFNGLDNDTIIKITTLLSKKLENKGIIIIASHQNLAIPHRTYDLT